MENYDAVQGGHDIHWALDAVRKEGKRVCRKGWDDSCFLVRQTAFDHMGHEITIVLEHYLCGFKQWRPKISDIDATDWMEWTSDRIQYDAF